MSEPIPPIPPPAPAPSGDPAPRWRRALGWLWTRIQRVAVWLWTRLRTGAGLVWTNVRDQEAPRSTRVLWAAGGLAGAGAVFATAVAILMIGYAILLWPFTPSVSDLRSAREVDPATVVSADGVTLTRFARRNREWRSLDEISPAVVEALVATEDRRFYRHGGIDLYGWAAVAAGALTGDGLRGASTLTQQLARNLFPDEIGTASSITRKLKEGITARKIERVYTKDEILELYLNTVPFLYNAHGIEMAARTYFSTDASSLNRLQASTLVGMLKGTSSYNPRRNPERALARRNIVLGQQVRYGDLDPAEAERLRGEPMGLRFERQPMQTSRAPHFTEHVRVRLEDWAEREGVSLYGDGLTIHTTLDWRMQQLAAESARKFGDALQTVADVEWGRASASRLGTTTAPYYAAARQTEPFERFWSLRKSTARAFARDSEAYRRATASGRDGEAVADSLLAIRAFRDSVRAVKMRLEVAMTAVDPETGAVRVWVGSRDFQRSAYDHVARARRQPGSTFKPFLYARALEEGFRPTDTLPDADVAIEMADGVIWQPTNASGTTSGQEITLRDGLAYSKNTIAARLVEEVGARDLARTAHRLGIESELEAVPSLALGTSEVSLLEMAGAYATLASGGIRRPPVTVTHITDRDGNEIARFAPEERRALDSDVAVTLVDMMRGVVDQGTGTQVRTAFGARGDLAGKTGTTQDGADGWFLLMRPDLVLGAWVGFDDPRVTFRSSYWGQGGHNALRVVGDLNRGLQRDGLVDTQQSFPTPEEAEEAGPGVWERFAGWVEGLGERVFGRDDGDLPDGYGPRTPGRGAEPDDRRERRDRRRDRERRVGDELDEWLAGGIEDQNARWLERAWEEINRIDDPRLRQAARDAVADAQRDLEDGAGGRGWAERARAARDRAIDQAQREIEREIAREARDLGGRFFDDEPDDVDPDDFELEPIEDIPLDDLRDDEGGRIGW
ncbi:penicillin-binding protein 1A [Rubrivirga sp. IMCC45206]|uniref:penicillin-binding protein 1A n=1 Tax=Rubrivirga sp. IMCC45206 TaxID=3391614 RepID=UPI00398FC89D